MNALIKRLRGYYEALAEEDMSAWDLPFGGDPEDFRKAADALAAMEWRPIEDAPRDEKIEFAKLDSFGDPLWTTSGVIDSEDGLYYCDITDEPLRWIDGKATFAKPTHFMLIKEMKGD